MIKEEYLIDNNIKIFDTDNLKNKRKQFFVPSSKIINKSDLTLNKRNIHRNEIFAKKRKIQLKSLIKEKNSYKNDQIEKSKFSLYLNDFLCDNVEIKLCGLKHLKKLLLLESTEKIEKQLINKEIIKGIISLSIEDDSEFRLECLSFLSIFTSKNTYFDLNFISKISQLINTENTDRNELSLIILSNLLYNINDPSIYQEISTSSLIQKLAGIIIQIDNVNLLLPALNCLYNIFVTLKGDSPIHNYFTSIESVKEFIQINIALTNFFQTEVEILSYIYPVLTFLLQIYKDKIVHLYTDLNFVRNTLTSLYIPITDSRLIVLKLLYNLISYSNSEFIDVLISNKFIEKLGEFLDSENKSLQKLTCKIIALSTNTTYKVGRIIIEKGILKIIYKNLHKPNQNKEHFLRIMHSLLPNIRDKDLYDRIDLKETVLIIGGLICIRNVSLIKSSLDLLISTLNLESSFNNSSILIPYMVNIGLNSDIEKLAYHQDKSVYERVLELLNFFNKMTD